MYVENPKCPHCSVELIEMDTVDMQYDYEGIAFDKVGECPECGREYQWIKSACCIQWANTDLRLV